MDLKFYLTICFDCWNLYLIKDSEMLMRIILHPDRKLRIPFKDEYVCGLQTRLWIVPFLDSLKLVFSYELSCTF